VTENYDTSIDGRVKKVQQEFAAKQTRFFMRFAMIESLLIVPVIIFVFVMELIDRQVGVWILLAIAAVGGVVMASLLLRLAREREVALNQARGITPII